MTIPAPTGVTARHAAGWAYLTVPRKAGHSTQVQYNAGQGWHDASQQVSEYLMPMYQHSDPTEWRARYTRAGTFGAWATGRVWYPDGFVQDDEEPQPTPPQPPSGLTVTETSGADGTASVEWTPAGSHPDEFWRVLLEDVDPQPRTVRTPATVFRHLETGRTYGWRVRTVYVDAEGFEHESAWIRGPEFQLDGAPPPPPPPPPVDPPSPPRAVRAHCIHANHAKVEWDANPPEENVTSYVVTVDGTVQREVIGTLVELHDLTPNTDYAVEVRACRDQGCSTPSSIGFRTGAVDPLPEPQPPDGAPAAPTGVYVDPIGPGQVQLSWTQPASDPAADWWSVTTDAGSHWVRATARSVQLDVPPGEQVRLGVAAVANGRDGSPTRLSQITMTGVKTAAKGA